MELNSTAIPSPQTFEVETFDITRTNRLASGKLVAETIATKKRFNFTYTSLTGAQLSALKALLYADYFLSLTYPTETGIETVTVARGDIDVSLLRNEGNKQYESISFELIEQ